MDEELQMLSDAEIDALEPADGVFASQDNVALESLSDDIRLAAGRTQTDATQEDKEAGNYRKGVVNIQGLSVAIENPRLTYRQGVSKDGRPWQTLMQWDYGYLMRTLGIDKQPVDVFLGPIPESEVVFVIDQIDQDTGAFDEHKVMLGWATLQSAIDAYLDNYEPGWKVGQVTTLTFEQFKKWLQGGWTLYPMQTIKDRLQAAMESSATPAEFVRNWRSYP